MFFFLTTGVERLIFYVVHFNVFAGSIPCEVAIAKFCIRKGLMKTMHELISVDKLPIGTAYEARKNHDDIHGLPLPPNALGSNDILTVLHKMADFCNTGKEPTILFAREKETETFKEVIEWMYKAADIENNLFTVCEITELLYQIKRIMSDTDKSRERKVVYAEAQHMLMRDSYEYERLGCKPHQKIGKDVHCAQSIVQRIVYQITHYCTDHFAIQLIPGAHVPMEFVVDVKQPDEPSKAHTTLATTIDLSSTFGNLSFLQDLNETNITQKTKNTTCSHERTNPFWNYIEENYGYNYEQSFTSEKIGDDTNHTLDETVGDGTTENEVESLKTSENTCGEARLGSVKSGNHTPVELERLKELLSRTSNKPS